MAAKDNEIPVIRRSDLLAALMEGHKQVLLAGTHGKTSTTSMTVSAMQHAGLDPSFAIGGQLNRAGTNAHGGTGEAFVAEADESDASLLRYSPDVAVLTTIEPDHLDFFHSEEAYIQVFDDFADLVTPETGYLVVCAEDEHAARAGERALERGINVVAYGSPEKSLPLLCHWPPSWSAKRPPRKAWRPSSSSTFLAFLKPCATSCRSQATTWCSIPWVP